MIAIGGLVQAAADSDADRVSMLAVAVALLFTAGQIITPWQNSVLAGRLGRSVTTELADRQTAGLLRPPTVSHLEDPEFLDQVSRATSSGGIGPWAATVAVLTRLTSRLIGLGSVALLAVVVDERLALLLLLALIWNVRTMSKAFLQLVEAANGRAAELRRTAYFAGLAREPRAAREIRIFELADWVLDRFHTSWTSGMIRVWAERRGASRAALVAAAPLVLSVTVVAIYIVGEVESGRLGPAAALVAVQALLGSMRLATVTRSDSWIAYGTAVLPAQEELDLQLRRLTQPPDSPGRVPDGPPRIELRDVAFSYPGARAPVLAELSLTIEAGRSLGIVGINGAGKTTLVKLLTGLNQPQSGRIYVDGIALDELDLVQWQRRTAVVFQDFVRFPLSLSDNVDLKQDEAVAEALVRAQSAGSRLGLDAIAGGLPHGWETVLSKQLGGVDLSGGQWQRVALARAVASLNRGAGLLILDEPTSQQDPTSEAAVYAELLGLAAGRTTILISHRLAAVRRADSIAVMHAGRVVEEGSHQALMDLEGRYAAMFTMQAEGYAAEAEATGMEVDRG